MNTAFGTAAQHNRTDVIEFLFRASTIEQQTLDKAIEDAAAGNGAATVLFLYNTGRISPQSIHKVFETTGSFAAIRRLFENERIPDNSIAAAFKKASGCGRNAYSHTKDSINIVKLLFKKKCISSDTFGEAYMIAHRRNCRAVVECLRGDARISSKKLGEAFARAADSGNLASMKNLFDKQHVSPEAILAAFKDAAVDAKESLMEFIAPQLFAENYVPCEARNQTLVFAVQNRSLTALRLLNENATGEWPLAVLKEAYGIATNCPIRNFISKIICDQLFDPRRGKRAKAMIKWVADWEVKSTRARSQRLSASQ